MPFTNRVRLPIELKKPQWPETREVYRKANGITQTLSSILEKTYQGATDWMSEKSHERLAVALAHDNVTIEGDKYLGGVSKDGDYEVAWSDFLDYPTAPAKFQVKVTPFENNNNNCMTCDELSQVVLVDDTFPDPMDEDTDYVIDAIANDSVCCYPVLFTITSFNSDYLDSATIDASGVVTVHTKTGLVSANGLLLVTYRATCGNGGYDEADIFGDINGTIPGCLAPTGLIITSILTTSANASWTAPSPAPDHYHWQLYKGFVLVTEADESGLSVGLTGLDPETSYTFKIYSVCEENSNTIEQGFITAPQSETCGNFSIFGNSGDERVPDVVTYLDCNGVYRTTTIRKFQTITICALQTSPSDYVDISTTGIVGISIGYLGLCT